MNAPLTLSVVLIKEHYEQKTLWVAQCLDYDVAAQGETIQEAKEAFGVAFSAQLAVYIDDNQNPLEMIPPAPQEYWDKFARGDRLADQIPIRPPSMCPPAWMIPSISAQHIRVV